MAWPPAIACRRVALVVFGLALMLYLILSGLFFVSGLDPRATVIAAQIIGLLGLSLFLARMMRIPFTEAFALRPATAVHWAMVIAAALPLQILGGALQFAALQRLDEDSPLRQLMEETLRQFIGTQTGVDLLLLFLAAVVTAAICEEMLFRGLILQLLRRRSGWPSAVFFSALLFAVFHLNPVVLVAITVVGSYLAILVWRSGSIYPSMAAHALNNTLALFAVPRLIDEATYSAWLAPIGLASGGTLALLMVVYFRATPVAVLPLPQHLREAALAIDSESEDDDRT